MEKTEVTATKARSWRRASIGEVALMNVTRYRILVCPSSRNKHNDDDALEIATRLIAALRLVGMETGTEGSFFLDSAKGFLRYAIALVRGAAVTPPLPGRQFGKPVRRHRRLATALPASIAATMVSVTRARKSEWDDAT